MLFLILLIVTANVALGYGLARYLGRIEREIVVPRPRLPLRLKAVMARFKRKPAA
jgi:hypothetical protein